jgi:hypothetical protein
MDVTCSVGHWWCPSPHGTGFLHWHLSPRLTTKVEHCIRHIQLSVLYQLATVSCTEQIINVASICLAWSTNHSNEHSCSIKGMKFKQRVKFKWSPCNIPNHKSLTTFWNKFFCWKDNWWNLKPSWKCNATWQI